MQTMQRQFGKLLPRTADESQVSVLLKDFEDADKMLAKLIDGTRAWRDSWRDIFTIQHRLIIEFHNQYQPIIGAGADYSGHEPVLTPRDTLERVAKLQVAYEELKNDLMDEVNQVDARITKPASEAREYLQPMKKVIKKRQDRKLDFERYQGRYDSAQKKTKRSERENVALAKHESDLARAKEEYQAADDRLKSSLPPMVTAAYSLLPHLLAAQIMIQHDLLARYYTILHDYCQEEGFPSPPPPMTDVVSVWESDFKPIQHELETTITPITNGKAIRTPMKQEDRQGSTLTGLNIRNGIAQRKMSSQSTSSSLRPSVSPVRREPSPARSDPISDPPSPNYEARPERPERPRMLSVPSQTSLALSTPNYGSTVTSPSPNEVYSTHSPAGPRADYFSRDRLPSNSSMSSIAAQKKKPPPPPPKRKPSNQSLWVTALYDFAGQGQGDLVFREGDQIKVVKKTDSTDDWWQGELKGVKGSFPANYCQPV